MPDLTSKLRDLQDRVKQLSAKKRAKTTDDAPSFKTECA